MEPLLAVQESKDADGKYYKLCYSSTHECKIINGTVSDWKLHGFGGIPIVEYPNNHERISDAWCDGCTSWSRVYGDEDYSPWKYAKLADGGDKA